MRAQTAKAKTATARTARAVIYARVSTDVQRDNYSIPSQISECFKYIDQKAYALVGDQFVDPENGLDSTSGNGSLSAYVDDYSSRELSRPSLDAALSYLERVGFDVLVVHALDRFSRDPYIRTTLEREFINRGAKVEYVLGGYDETPEGEVRKDLDATFGKWENAKRVERCNRGKRRKAESGIYVGGRRPYGYERDDSALAGLAVNEEQAEVVQRIFDLYVNQGESIRGIANILNGEGVPPSHGKAWGKSSVYRILTQNTYAGTAIYNRTRRVASGEVVERDRDEWIELEVTPIIPAWLFDKAQAKLAESLQNRRAEPRRFYLLTGMVWCADCQRPYISQTTRAGRKRLKNDSQHYRHRAKEGHCHNKYISARKIEPVVWEEIRSMLLDPQTLLEGYRQSLEQQQSSYERQLAYHEQLHRQLDKLQQQRENLTAIYIDPDISMTRDEYIAQKTRIDDTIKAVQKDIERVESELSNIPQPQDLETLEVFAQSVRERLESDLEPDPQDVRTILELLHIKVWIGLDGSAKITGWFGDTDSLTSKSSARKERQTIAFSITLILAK